MMSIEPALRQRWLRLGRSCGAGDEVLEVLFADIARRYGESHRAYHTLQHLAAMFSDCDRFGVDSAAVAFATWFHDIVYRPGAVDNEARSAGLAVAALAELSVAPPLAARVEHMILCSRDHRNPGGDHETGLFLDADMAILGAGAERYKRYAEAVRREFRRVPGWWYRRGRRRFLRGVLAAPRIFQSPAFYDAYEARARVNMTWELTRL